MIAPVELIRLLIPTRIRIKVYVWAIALAGKSKLLLYPFLFIHHGHIPKGVTIVNNKPLYHYKGIEIDSPMDSIEAYVEVFLDKVYDRQRVPQKGDIVIDIGAYVGMYSIMASQYAKNDGKVISVEPLPSNLVYLRNNTEGIPNIQIAEVALSNYVGIGKLYTSPSTAAHSMTYVRDKYIEVKVTTLDNLVKELELPRVDYIKMDAEGSDMNILEGAIGVLNKYHPVLSIACYHTDKDGIPYVNKVMAYLMELGYKCVTDKGYIYANKEDK